MRARTHAYNDQRSLWLHRAIARKLLADPDAVRARARANLARMRHAHGASLAPYVKRWEALLAGPLDVLAAELTADDQEARDLRQCTPMAGVLTPQERWALYRDFRASWDGAAQ